MNLNKIAKFLSDYVFATFALPVGLILIIFGYVIYGPVLTRQDYPQTDAVVSRTELYEDAYYDSASETHHDATYRIFVKYSLNGEEYEEEYGIFPEMKVGANVKIAYNPDDPRDISQPNTVLLPIGIIAGGTVCLAAGVVSVVKTRKKNEKLKKQEEEWNHKCRTK